MTSFLKQLSVYVSLLAIGGGAGFLGSRYLEAQKNANSPQTLPVVLRTPARAPLPASKSALIARGNPNFVAEVAQKVGPAVVRIDSARKVASQIPQALDNPLFRQFFGEDTPIPEERFERGTGSGFITSSDGEMLTNAHVVAGADVVDVTLKDGRTFKGKVLGIDPLTDVAVVKIDAKDLPTVQLGKSESLVPGQWAIAIGNPLGLDNTVTVGIISATDRSSSQVGIPDKRVRFIQTDAAINPGNSGGPLLNDQGEVIGINTAIRANAQGLGFSIPIETAKRIATDLATKGRAEHPFLGIKMVQLTPARQEEINQQAKGNFKITQDKGVLILGVLNDSPAQKAGLREGDIIQKIDGAAIETTEEVQDRVEASGVGSELNLEINRNGKIQRIEVRPEAFPLKQLE
ncbi:HhoA/HhoB/HtrA family serine endopeptidase [Microcoleus sp. FACHB-68]|uniref:HhoA/HhoB/HtrA family serine endopeptidase n=1 Tax=Microcoleus sp. FACHB-68 TaxID=2692826 RepID=UPI001682A83F|nr:HhoA/HhoB/HtrA family serine endopeptidase [Microcoleus sp. FACHB-68]MBD1939491.1 trypsin-like peptidase domain-containing protein [Microcoleus sp. FACHB-68]